MRHLTSRLLPTVVAVAALAGTLAFRSQAQDPIQDDQATFRADSRLVVLHASVVGKEGKLLTDVPRGAFKVFENGVEQQIKIFRREDVPVSLGIIIDNSGSMRDKRQKVGAAALKLIQLSNPQDEVFVVNFNDDAYLDAPMTSDMKKLEEALTNYETRGGTAMRDALSMSLDYVKKNGKKDKKVLLVVTDGNDNTSMETLERLVRRCQQSEVLIYAIGLLTEEDNREAKKAKRALKELTVATGGTTHYPDLLPEVEKIAEQVAHEVRNQYVIAYTPTVQELDNTYRQIKVTVNGYGNPTVRTRSGYYASKDTGGKQVSQKGEKPSPDR